ncbi:MULTISPECIES: MarR family winged helix-turn-helix transcriptional regulator [Variovorax]|jgi:DNA-binding MarR family transcriptional regulator|uniref:MarR family winged helix-turn-helix transcriptional regulator n=1 Tax=Variovorax TaxID=34072 RepID=UPI000895B41D|nr:MULTISPECIES: MarR family transcriptional regulator [Variovorax]MDQ0085718.1 DNA-binding MarR family transcriptional regulator [Variovorax boronicumulans]SDZ64776.1 transcriptional regulator, MarR family [Variovorax sp. YR266]SEU21473.1 transcriptional regulator, MarR family [Variovorax sp. OV084]SOD29174.1 transcriptional regulator, MarR family [Variovorax sp. YR752]
MKRDFTQRFGFLVKSVGKLYSEEFDRLARERIGLTSAQCRLLGALAMHGDEEPLSQAELAQRLDLTPMAVAGLCDRMAAAGWIRREPSATDRRVNKIHLEPSAEKALDSALSLSDGLNARVMAVLSQPERAQLLSLLAKVQGSLVEITSGEGKKP